MIAPNTINQQPRKFPLGMLVQTPGSRDVLDVRDVRIALARHERCDWGDCCPDDIAANNDALNTGGRLLSAYTDRMGIWLWIITEADRSATTVLLPDEY